MRGRAIGVALAGVGGLVARPLAAKLHARLIAGCERMFEQMPDTFPPKRMMRGIEEIRATAQGLSRSSRRASSRRRRTRRGVAARRKRSSPGLARASPSTIYDRTLN